MVAPTLVRQRLREWRAERGYSQRRAAEAVDLKEHQWARWETGRTAPRADNLAMLAERMEIPLADFYDPDAFASDNDRFLEALTRIEAKLDVLLTLRARLPTSCSIEGGAASRPRF